MRNLKPKSERAARARFPTGPQGLIAVLPRVPLALTLVAVGIINILDSLKLPLTKLRSIETLYDLEPSLSAVGGAAEVILGILLVVAGLGLLRRLGSAWTVAVLLLAIAMAVRIARAKLGLGFALQVVTLVALILTRRHFTRRTAMASVVYSLINIVAILV